MLRASGGKDGNIREWTAFPLRRLLGRGAVRLPLFTVLVRITATSVERLPAVPYLALSLCPPYLPTFTAPLLYGLPSLPRGSAVRSAYSLARPLVHPPRRIAGSRPN